MKAEKIIEVLATKGVKAEVKELTKNGVTKTGIQVNLGNVCPVFYPDTFKVDTEEEVADEIIDFINNNEQPQFDVEFLKDFEKVKDALQLCICNAEVAQFPHVQDMNLAKYARVIIGDGTTVVTEQLLETWGKSIDEVLAFATLNLFKDGSAQSLAELMGLPVADNMIVISNSAKAHGASQMFNGKLLAEVAERLEDDLIVLPSSIHEVIAVPASSGDAMTFANMVKDVNATQVAPEEQLSNSVYHFSRKEKRLTLAE